MSTRRKSRKYLISPVRSPLCLRIGTPLFLGKGGVTSNGVSLLVVVLILPFPLSQAYARLCLSDGWRIKSSDEITEKGNIISTPGYSPEGWYPTAVPSTVLAALEKNGVYPDLYFGMNLDSLPKEIFESPWWYRGEFQLPSDYRGENARSL